MARDVRPEHSPTTNHSRRCKVSPATDVKVTMRATQNINVQILTAEVLAPSTELGNGIGNIKN